MKELSEGETHGVFWFFAGPLAVDGKNQIDFNLGPHYSASMQTRRRLGRPPKTLPKVGIEP
jgi:hypothetical protein